jgi:hypothetical protein
MSLSFEGKKYFWTKLWTWETQQISGLQSPAWPAAHSTEPQAYTATWWGSHNSEKWKKKSQAYGLARATASAQFPHRLIQKSREADLVIGRMKTDIFRPYSIRNPFLFKMIQIHLNPSLYIRHRILYSYPNIVYLWYWYPIVSCPVWLILSVFKFESEHKYENKYDINNICSYLIRFHL